MLDPELKAEFTKMSQRSDAEFAKVHGEIESLAGHMANGFTEINERFDQVYLKIDGVHDKLQNQIDSLMSSKADRSEVAAMHTKFRNLQTI